MYRYFWASLTPREAPPPFDALVAELLRAVAEGGHEAQTGDLIFMCPRQGEVWLAEHRLTYSQAARHYEELLALRCPVVRLGFYGAVAGGYLVVMDHAGSTDADGSAVGWGIAVPPDPPVVRPARRRRWRRHKIPICDVTGTVPQSY